MKPNLRGCFNKSLFILTLLNASCGAPNKKDGPGDSPKFSSKSTTKLSSSTLLNLVSFWSMPVPENWNAPGSGAFSAQMLEGPPELQCMEMTTCYTPTVFSGKILAAGLGISAKG
jgi:hypothetical protein